MLARIHARDAADAAGSRIALTKNRPCFTYRNTAENTFSALFLLFIAKAPDI